MAFALRLAARLPLRFWHACGAVVGYLVYAASPRYRRRLEQNLQSSRIAPDARALRQLRRQAVAEAGKALCELIVLWGRPLDEVAHLVRSCEGWEHVQAAQAAGRGVIFLTPHLGCFEGAALYAASRLVLTVLYRPPKLAALTGLMQAGRSRGGLKLARTDLSGVRQLLIALSRGEAVGILPDQVPAAGQGVWAPFFGRPAYTMTLAAKLAHRSGAPVLFAVARRLPKGKGYALSITPSLPFTGKPEEDARRLNAAIEALVRSAPGQYLWSYNRYKGPGKPR